MAKDRTASRSSDTEKSKPTDGSRYSFKRASELPRSKPDYVVQSPTPLGQRSVPHADKHK
jgi:hypothetical protein